MESEIESQKLILVTGITGQQGGAVAHELLQRGYRIRGLTRDSSTAEALDLSSMGIDMQEGDFADAGAMQKAVEGVYGIFLNTPPVPDQVTIGKSVVDLARNAGIHHLVYSSYLIADFEHGIPSFPKAAIERHLSKSGLPYTILRPATFMENFNGAGAMSRIQENGISDPRQASTVRQLISVEDIAYFAADAFDDPQAWLGQSLNIAGDEFTGAEMAEIFSRVMGTQVTYSTPGWDEWGTHMPPGHVEMYRWFEDTGFGADISTLRRQHPGLRSFEDFLRYHDRDN